MTRSWSLVWCVVLFAAVVVVGGDLLPITDAHGQETTPPDSEAIEGKVASPDAAADGQELAADDPEADAPNPDASSGAQNDDAPDVLQGSGGAPEADEAPKGQDSGADAWWWSKDLEADLERRFGPLPEDSPEGALAARFGALEAARQSLIRQENTLAEREARVQKLWEEAKRLQVQAGGSEQNGLVPSPLRTPALSEEERTARMNHLVDILKKMKPKAAAAMIAVWDDAFAVDVLQRLPARTASPILAKMPAELGGRLTARLGSGHTVIRLNTLKGGL